MRQPAQTSSRRSIPKETGSVLPRAQPQCSLLAFLKWQASKPEWLALSGNIDFRVAFCYLAPVSQPVKISDSLLLDARLTAETAERSIAGQIEFWARLGRAIEPLLRGDKALALRRAGDAQPLSKCFSSVNSPAGRQRLARHLKELPFPHYEPADTPGLLVRIDANGRRTVGRFVNREFVPAGKKRTPARRQKA